MAHAIPKAEWSEAEEHRGRLFYWEYLVNHWLMPGPSVIHEQSEPHTSLVAPSPESLQQYGWLLEPESICEH